MKTSVIATLVAILAFSAGTAFAAEPTTLTTTDTLSAAEYQVVAVNSGSGPVTLTDAQYQAALIATYRPIGLLSIAPAFAAKQHGTEVSAGYRIAAGAEFPSLVPCLAARGLSETTELVYYHGDFKSDLSNQASGSVWSIAAYDSIKYTLFPASLVPTPFISGGFGPGYIHTSGTKQGLVGGFPVLSPISISTHDWALMYQVSAGIAYETNWQKHYVVDLAYRYEGSATHVTGGAIGVHSIALSAHF